MEPSVTTALDTNLALLEQGVDAIDHLGQEGFSRIPSGHSSIGAHLRHVLDHYQCFLNGLATGRIDYDARARDPETELVASRARERLLATAAVLRDLPRESVELPLMVNAASGAHGDRPPAWTATTAVRELGFLQSHTVHHYAVIKLLAELDGRALDEGFGVAPATLAWRARHD